MTQRKLIAGIDEVGYGSLAGPILITAVVVPDFEEAPDNFKTEAGDSKKFSKKKRVELAPLLAEEAIFVGLGWAGPDFINKYGVSRAWNYAAELALRGAPVLHHIYVDGVNKIKGLHTPQTTVIKGDDKLWCIGAASIIGKVSRDLCMEEMAEQYPGYGWETNSGYGSKAHISAIKEYGPTRYHRTKYIRKFVNG